MRGGGTCDEISVMLFVILTVISSVIISGDISDKTCDLICCVTLPFPPLGAVASVRKKSSSFVYVYALFVSFYHV